ncbi:uncharacterized protein LOC144577419 isoform X2 [Callithrix jacchus]
MKLPFLRCRIIWRKKRRFLERENQRNLPRRDVLQESNALMYVKSLEKHKSEARTAASALVTWFGLCIPSWSQSLQCQRWASLCCLGWIQILGLKQSCLPHTRDYR